MKLLALAVSFLTIIPWPGARRLEVGEDDLTRCTAAFVAVGLLQGLVLVLADFAFGYLFHPDLALWLVLLTMVLLSGGFHLDGLADSFDALAVKSSGEPAADLRRRLAAMKDSTTGAIGMLAIFFALIIKFQALKTLSHGSYASYYTALLLLPAVGKWAMVAVMPSATASRPDGLGRLFLGRVGRRQVAWAAASLLVALLLPALLLAAYLPPYSWLFYLSLPLLLWWLALLVSALCHRRFGGLNGDNLGAINEFAEIFFLLAALLWLRFAIW